jgi:diaminopimelate decarboxylase
MNRTETAVLRRKNLEPVDFSLLPLTAEVTDRGLSVGGVDLLSLAAEFGTPLFVYDAEAMRQKFEEAFKTFGEGVAYATKAFLCKAVARMAYSCGLSLDVASGGEYHVCREAGVPAGFLALHGNNKLRSEISRAVDEGVQWIVLDSFDDLASVSREAEAQRRVARVLIRINPGVEVHTHRFNATGNRNSKFGFPMWTGDAERALEMVRNNRWLDLLGIHIHIGSLVYSIECFTAGLDSVVDFVKSADLEYFVAGGGLGVRYLNSDVSPTFAQWSNTILEHCESVGIRGKILAEPGRSLVAAAAVTLYSVGGISIKGERTFVAVDGGMSDNLRPLLYESGYEAFLVRDTPAVRDIQADIVGRHCESGDTLVRDAWLPRDVKVGDIISTPVTGAYGYSMSSNYNRMPRPAVVFVEGGNASLVIRRETYEDLLICDVG